MTRLALGALGLGLAILSLLPWSAWLGLGRPDQVAAYGTTVASWIRWTTTFVLLGGALGFVGRVESTLERWRRTIAGWPDRPFALALAGIALLSGAILSGVLFARNPHLVDTIAQLFQARILKRGHLTAPAPEHYEFFAASHLVRHEGRWFAQYPPGHPALLAFGLGLGVPWLVSPVFGAGTLALVYATARRLLGRGSAKLAAVLYLLSPFVVFMSASYMNHITCGFFLTLALYAAVRSGETAAGRSWGGRWAVITGVALGLAAAIRPLEAAAWSVVLGIWLLWRHGVRPAVTAGTACLLSLAPLLLYNALTTGAPLTFGYTLLWGPGHGLGFHESPWGEPFTPSTSFRDTSLDFQQLNIYLFGWPFPSLVFVFVALGFAVADARGRAALARIALLAGLSLAGPLAYFFYWHRDEYLGPRFAYSAVVPLVLLTVVGLEALDRRLGRWRASLRVLLVLAAAFSLTVYIPDRAGILAGKMTDMKLDPVADASRAGIDEGLVFVKVGWGSRLVARLWGWGISAPDAETTFRAVDGCRIQRALDDADSAANRGIDSARVRSRLSARLREWSRADLPIARDLLPDGSVRLDTTRALDDRCLDEVLRDRTGFTVYGTLIWRNDPWLRDGLVWARDLGPEINARLRERYRDREVYVYAPSSPDPRARPALSRARWPAPTRPPGATGRSIAAPDGPRSGGVER